METNIMTEGKKNIIMSINTEKFAKDLQKEEKTLKSLQRTNANEAVIDAQKQVIKTYRRNTMILLQQKNLPKSASVIHLSLFKL